MTSDIAATLAALGPLELLSKPTTDSVAYVGDSVFVKVYRHDVARTLPPPLADRIAAEEAIAGASLHPAIIRLKRVKRCIDGFVLIYDRVIGAENLGDTETKRRFLRLPAVSRCAAVCTMAEALAGVTEIGYTVVDWYDSNMLYHFDTECVSLFDWELCRRGDHFELDMDENYGSSRLMAPEEFLRGARIDARSLVFNLGRYALLTLPDVAIANTDFARVIARSTHPTPDRRFRGVRAFAKELRHAIER